jgi:hypothetical protein
MIDFHGHELPQFTGVFNLVSEVEHWCLAECPQRGVEAGAGQARIAEAKPRNQQAEDAQLIAPWPQPLR